MIDPDVWQAVPGTRHLEVFAIITKPSIVSSNCYLLRSRDALFVVDPGADAAQTITINRLIAECCADAPRPVYALLTHCHQDHSQESAALATPGGDPVRLAVEVSGARAMASGDRYLTVAAVYPWQPQICPQEAALPFFAGAATASAARRCGIRVVDTRVETPAGALPCQRIELADGDCIEILHTPGHTDCSVCVRAGDLLLLGDVPFAANAGICGLWGWSQQSLLASLDRLDHLIGEPTLCGPGHGRLVAGRSMARLLRNVRSEAASLDRVTSLDLERIHALTRYLDELLEEAAALFTVIAGRLYTLSLHLDRLDEPAEAERLAKLLDLEQIDRTLGEFREYRMAFDAAREPGLVVVMRGLTMVRTLQTLFGKSTVAHLVGDSLVGRAGRLLDDFVAAVRGLDFGAAEAAGDLNGVAARIATRVSPADPQPLDLAFDVLDGETYLRTLVAQMASRAFAARTRVELVRCGASVPVIGGVQRIEDTVDGLLDVLAGQGVPSARLEVTRRDRFGELRLAADQPLTAELLTGGRLALYDRMLGALGGGAALRDNGVACAWLPLA